MFVNCTTKLKSTEISQELSVISDARTFQKSTQTICIKKQCWGNDSSSHSFGHELEYRQQAVERTKLQKNVKPNENTILQK